MKRLRTPILALLLATTLHAQPASDPATALFAALKDHDTKVLQSLLAHGVSPSLRDSFGNGALNLAAQNGDLDAIKILLAAGADINDSDRFGPPIYTAVSFNQLDAASYLLAHGAHVDARNMMDQTPLIWAVRANRTEMAALLLDHGADINAVDRTKVPLLTIAALANDQDIVALLRKAGAHYATPEEELMAAASYGDAVRIRELIAAGTPVDTLGSSYASPAARETPLMAAAEKGQTVAVRALLSAGANVNATDRERGTALFYALKSKHRSTVDALLDAGADPLVKMGGGLTPLMQLATYMDDPGLAHKFIDAGVDPNATTNGAASTALMQAATFGHSAILRVLIDAGVDIDAVSGQEGETALIQAARSGETACVRLLLAAHADTTVRDRRKDSGRNAYEWAIQFHHPDTAELLEPKPH